MRRFNKWAIGAVAGLALGLGAGERQVRAGLMTSLSDPGKPDDLTPPPWRGTPGSTFQQWDFTPPLPTMPTAVNNPFGTPELTSTGAVMFGVTAGGRANVVQLTAPAGQPPSPPPGTGRLLISVPNMSATDLSKEISLQVTYLGALPPSGVPNPVPRITIVGQDLESFTMTSSQSQALPDGYIHQLTTWRSATCPASEFITIFPLPDPNSPQKIFIDQVIVDTRCVPEPSSLVLGTIGALTGLGAGLRKRRAAARTAGPGGGSSRDVAGASSRPSSPG
ncbi:PEP-CTERM protein-sorting domain-containing protein [Singulisphaera sp. GP187]|uniref:hypothetical protein n=1 Tax=Singulisphaera sp. GP187 TaxID=1882752 RepID=UPI000927D525|nr:hypothetical protein [Singulisphaera sp. GP187]SIO46254.1 PEP-CTERM protein-sorting domain-containing protein [Singulisphaera sp. GP187]